MMKSWPLLVPEWLEIRLGIWQVKREIRSLNRDFRIRIDREESQGGKDAIHADWALEAEWPESNLAFLESRMVRRIAHRLNLRVPQSVQDPFTGHWHIANVDLLELKREITKERRARATWWIQILVMPLIGLLGVAAAVLSLLLHRLE